MSFKEEKSNFMIKLLKLYHTKIRELKQLIENTDNVIMTETEFKNTHMIDIEKKIIEILNLICDDQKQFEYKFAVGKYRIIHYNKKDDYQNFNRHKMRIAFRHERILIKGTKNKVHKTVNIYKYKICDNSLIEILNGELYKFYQKGNGENEMIKNTEIKTEQLEFDNNCKIDTYELLNGEIGYILQFYKTTILIKSLTSISISIDSEYDYVTITVDEKNYYIDINMLKSDNIYEITTTIIRLMNHIIHLIHRNEEI